MMNAWVALAVAVAAVAVVVTVVLVSRSPTGPTPQPATAEPTVLPGPTAEPTERPAPPVPTPRPTPVPTARPTPTWVPTPAPTARPSWAPMVCSLPLSAGMCTARKPRYGFDARAGKCREFAYGGCGGNANRFMTVAECERTCPATTSSAPTQAPRPPPSGNPACTLPAETGMCLAKLWRYGYDPKVGKCTVFMYGGCGGNANNFASEADCQRACLATQPPKPVPPPSGNPACALPLVGGLCKTAGERKFGFDTATGRCTQFWHFCGNANRFDSEAECQRACVTGKWAPTAAPKKKKKVSATCALPLVAGECRAAFPRYGFDAKAGACRRFTYGGCGGNANNFASEAECARACPATR